MSSEFDWVSLVTGILGFVAQLLIALADIFGW
jgi:hypothetical protein